AQRKWLAVAPNCLINAGLRAGIVRRPAALSNRLAHWRAGHDGSGSRRPTCSSDDPATATT
ncbi:MAG: hypothetical protein ACRDV3_01720, partial [Acidothermaceae bacterium]